MAAHAARTAHECRTRSGRSHGRCRGTAQSRAMSGAPMPGKLLLVRHGQSIWNLENLFTGWTDVDLSAQGVLEAQRAGLEIARAGVLPDIVYTSVLKRAIRTEWLILEALDL